MVADGREGLGSEFLDAEDLEGAYQVPRMESTSGTVIAVLAIGDYTSVESDLAQYRNTYGLPPCTSANGCFSKVNQFGNASPLPAGTYTDDAGVHLNGAASEIALDVEMVSAACPNCSIVLVEAGIDWSGLGNAIHTAASRARYVTISYNWGESGSASDDDALFNSLTTAYFNSSGDVGSGWSGGVYPATSPHVTAVGGTFLARAPGTARGWTEEAWTPGAGGWGGSGSACSSIYPTPSWQSSVNGCGGRASADVSAAALYIAVYFNGGWIGATGTSCSAPFVAGLYAATNTHWGPSAPYAFYGSFQDVTTWAGDSSSNAYFVGGNTNGTRLTCPGNQRYCTVGAGWDGPTGMGSPNGFYMARPWWDAVDWIAATGSLL